MCLVTLLRVIMPIMETRLDASISADRLTVASRPRTGYIDPSCFNNKLPCSPDHPAKMGEIWVPPVC